MKQIESDPVRKMRMDNFLHLNLISSAIICEMLIIVAFVFIIIHAFQVFIFVTVILKFFFLVL